MDLVYAVIAGGTGAGGAYAAVWAHLKFHKGYIDEHRETLKEHGKRHQETDKRLTWLEAHHQR